MPPSLPQSSATEGGRAAEKTVTVKVPCDDEYFLQSQMEGLEVVGILTVSMRVNKR